MKVNSGEGGCCRGDECVLTGHSKRILKMKKYQKVIEGKEYTR